MALSGGKLRVFVVGGVAALLLASCSGSDDSEVAGPDASSQVETTTVEESSATTAAVDVDRALGLPVDPPSTTISSDPDEQAAADVVFLYAAMIDRCIEDLVACDPTSFDEIATKNAINDEPTLSLPAEEYEPARLGFDAEHEIRWVKKIDGEFPIVQVLHCFYPNQYPVKKGEAAQTEFGTALLVMSRVIQQDGRWLFDDIGPGAEYKPEELSENVCGTFTEQSEQEIRDLFEEGAKE